MFILVCLDEGTLYTYLYGIDQTPSAVIGRVQLHMKEEADILLQGRVRVIK